MTHEKTRLNEPFFFNYDLYDAPGGPGAGFYSNMDKYKSVKDFINKKRKRKNKRKKTQSRRIALLKLAFNFPIDEQITPILSDSDVLPIMGGFGDRYFETKDFEGKTPDNLDYTRVEGYDDNIEKVPYDEFIGMISQLINSPNESLIGLPDGLKSDEVDSTETNSQKIYNNITETFPSNSIFIT